MPYSKAHKARTRARIVEAAAHAFRQEGVNGVGIPAVMQQAGLTHGGFYAHFASKDGLVAEACAAGFAESAERLLRQVARRGPDDALHRIIAAYLSPQHRDNPASGCMIPAIAGEVAHSSAEVRAAFTHGLADYARQLGAYLPASGDGDIERRTDDALVLLSGLAGALLLARAVSDAEMSERILAAARTFYTQVFSENAITNENAQNS